MRIIQRLILLAVFFAILVGIIAYARGYRIDFQKSSLKSSGILSVSSNPKAAKVYVDGQLKGATDMNLPLAPGTYSVEIKKDGYTNFSRKVSLKGELVMGLDALLFPVNPSLSPLTNLGIVKAISLDQIDKVLIFSESNDDTKDGIYLFDPSKKAISFFPPLKLIILKKDLPSGMKLKDALVYISADYKQIIVEFPGPNQHSFLLSLEEENKSLFDVTFSKQTLLEAWEKEKDLEKNKILETFPKDIVKVASDSFHIISYSPDETKMIYASTKNLVLPSVITPPLIATNQTTEERTLKKDNLYLYDKKEDKNFKIPNSSSLHWYPDSKHLVFVDGKKIVAIDYDGSNKQIVYSGPFDNTFYSISSDGKLLILLNLNPETNNFLDLYFVGIR